MNKFPSVLELLLVINIYNYCPLKDNLHQVSLTYEHRILGHLNFLATTIKCFYNCQLTCECVTDAFLGAISSKFQIPFIDISYFVSEHKMCVPLHHDKKCNQGEGRGCEAT